MVYAYNVACPNIFQPKWYHRYRVFGFSAKYDNIQLKEYLENWLGAETLLKDIQQRVVVTAFRVDGKESAHDSILNSQTECRGRWRPAVFSNLPTLEGVARTDDKLLAVDACLRSSAAPTFFPSKTSLYFFLSRIVPSRCVLNFVIVVLHSTHQSFNQSYLRARARSLSLSNNNNNNKQFTKATAMVP